MTRPSLLQTADVRQSVNVLDAIDARDGTARQPSSAQRRVLWALVPIVAVGLWVAMSNPGIERLTAQAIVPTPPNPAVASAEAPNIAAAEVSATVHPVAMAPEPEPAPRPLEDLKPLQPTVIQANAAGGAPFEALAALSPSPAVSQPAKPSTRAAGPRAAEAKPTSKAPTRTVASSTPKPEKSAHATAKARVRAPSAATDPDVELLSALMQHMGDAKAKTPPARTLAQQVRECRRTGDAACQRRVCAGVWGQEKSCPSHLAPSPGTNTRASAAPG